MFRRFLVGRTNTGGALYVYHHAHALSISSSKQSSLSLPRAHSLPVQLSEEDLIASAVANRCSRRFQSTRSSAAPPLSGFYNAGGTSPWFVYFQTTPNEDCMKFVIEGHEFLANMMPEDSAIYKAEQRRMNPPKAVAKAPFVVARRERLVAEAEEKRRAAEFAERQRCEKEEEDQRLLRANEEGKVSTSSDPSSSMTVRTLVDLPSEEPYIDEDGLGGASHHDLQAPNTPEAEAMAAASERNDQQSSLATEETTALSTPASPKSPSVEQRVAPMTMTFNRDNGYLSPLANALLEGIPDLIEDVTIGHHFITVRRTLLDELKWKYYDDDIEGERLLKEEEEKKQAKKAAAAAAANAVSGGSGVSAGPFGGIEVDDRMSPLQVAEAMAEITNACALPAQLHAAGNNAKSLKAERTDYSAEEEEAIAIEGVELDRSKAEGSSSISLDPESEEVFRANYDPERLKRVIPIADAQLSWTDLQLQISAILTDHMYSRKPHVTPDAPHPHADTLPKEGDSEALLAIKELIAGTIRPLVQEDGGDLRLIKFEPIDKAEVERINASNKGFPVTSSSESAKSVDEGSCARTELPSSSELSSSTSGGNDVNGFQSGRLHIEMLGACKSCKSSKTTLKDMIERTLQHWVPEVAEVVEVNMARRASALGRSQK